MISPTQALDAKTALDALCHALAEEIESIENPPPPKGGSLPPQKNRLPGLRRALAIANEHRGQAALADDANRLDDDMRATIVRSVDETISVWNVLAGLSAADGDCLFQLAARSIGCSTADLRRSEADEIRNLVAGAVATAFQAARTA